MREENIQSIKRAFQKASADVVSSMDSMEQLTHYMDVKCMTMPGGFFIGFTVLILAMFLGYYVIWRVTPSLHSPLMAVTNAISSVIIVSGILALGQNTSAVAKFMGFWAVLLASINIFGGFLVADRMLQMFKRKKDNNKVKGE